MRPSTPDRDPPILARLAITLGAPFVVWLLGRYPMPALLPFEEWPTAAEALMGLTPVVLGFLGVELVAALVPSLRPLRASGPAGRAHLTGWAWRASTALMALGLLRTGLTWQQDGMFSLPWFMVLVVANPLWTVVLVWFAQRVSSQGLANGFAVLLLAELLPRSFLMEMGTDTRMLIFLSLLWLVLVASLVASRRAAVPHGEVVLRAPLSGVLPVVVASACLHLPMGPGAALMMVLPLDWLYLLEDTSALYLGATVVLVALLTPAFARLFYPPAAVAGFAGVAAPGDVHGALRKGVRYACFVTLTLALVPTVGDTLLGVPFAYRVAPGLTLLLVLAQDIRDEWRARNRDDTLVSVWSEHRAYAVDPLCAALSQTGIPFHARAVRYHALMNLFAPLVPVELLVPRARAAEAMGVLQARNEARSAHLDGHAPTTF